MKTFPTTLLRLEQIFSISHEIASNPSLDDILHMIVQVAKELVDCETAGIMLSDVSNNRLNFVASTQNLVRLYDIPVPIDRSIAGAAFTSNKPLIVNDAWHDPRYYPIVDELLSFSSHSILAVPLTFREREVGVIEAVNKKQGQFDEADIEVLVVLAAQATIAIEIARLYRQAQDEIAGRIKVEDELRRHQDHLEELVKERTAEVHRLAITDPLTGLFHRGHMMTLGDQAMRKARDHPYSFSVIMVDIDHFRKVNETYGHAVGDEVLKKLAGMLRQQLPSIDIIGRYSGEEFAVLMPHTNLQSAYELADHLLNQIREVQFDTVQGQFGITASIGLVEMDQARPQTLDSLIDLADQAMYAAKQAGRNQVFVGNLLAEVQRLATTDSSTSLFTRDYWTLLGNQTMQEAQRSHIPLSAMMIDGDHIKNINDTYGHAMGDEAVRRLAGILRQNLRSTDIIGRYGGDEFVVLMPHTNLHSAGKLADRLLNQIRKIRINTHQGQFGFTASIGVVEMDQDRPQSLDALIDHADHAAYAAKRAGRNQVSVA